VADVLSGRASLRFRESVAGYLNAVNGIEIEPWHFAFTGWLLLASGIVVAIKYRRDAPLLMVTVIPPALAIAGYAFFLSGLDNYYYLSLMPAAVLMVVLAFTAAVPPRLVERVGMLLVVLALAIVPMRRGLAMTINQMPEYGAIVHASRVIANRGTSVRAIRTNFKLRPTNDPEFVYRILGGQIDRTSPWVATIEPSGEVAYQNVGAP
jgi:hypothetical protein